MTPETNEPTVETPKVKARKPAAPKARVAKPAPAPTAVADIAVSGSDFLGAVKEIINANKAPEKITAANRVPRNPMNPTNEPRKFAKPFFQNFEEVDVDDLTSLEYELIPQLKAGLFIKSRKGVPLVEVLIVKRGAQRGIHLRYDNSKADKSIELMTYAPSLEIMLQRCITEAAKQAEVKLARRAAGLPDEDED